MVKRIGIFLFECLPHTETFIYEDINNLRNFQPHILAKVFSDNTQFNFKNHIVNYQYHKSFLVDALYYCARSRYFRNSALRYLLNIKEPFCEYVKRSNIQLLHAHFALDGLYALSLSSKCKIPLIVSLHGGYDTNVVINMKRFPKEEFFRKTDLFIVPSVHSKSNLLLNGCPEHKIRVLYHGVSIDNVPQRNIKEDKEGIRLLLVGRMTEKKGILDAISAFALLRDKYKNIRLTLIIGEKRKATEVLKEGLKNMGRRFPFNSSLGYEKKVLKQIQRLNLKKEISIVCELPHNDVRQTMTEYDIFLLPSKTACDGDEEGMPLVLIEAQAAGLPVVTTTHAGNPEAVIDGKTGYVVPEGDIEEIAKRLELLIKDEGLRNAMGKEGAKRVESHFAMSRRIELLENIYDQVLARCKEC